MISESSRPLFSGIGALVLASLAICAPECRAEGGNRAYLSLDAASYEEFNSAINLAEDLGVFLAHRFYPNAAMGTVPEGSESLLEASPFIARVYVGRVPDVNVNEMTRHEAYLAKAYNSLFFPSDQVVRPSLKDGEPHTARKPVAKRSADAAAPDLRYDPRHEGAVPVDVPTMFSCSRTIPQEYLDEITAASGDDPPPIFGATSEFLLGHVVVSVIMPESEPGAGSHDWDETEELTATEEVIGAMDWWAKNGPERRLCFSYDFNYRVPVPVEPMALGGAGEDYLWAGPSLQELGYGGVNHFQQCYECIDDMRDKYRADWGFVAFILDGREDQSFGQYLGYSYIGGPYHVTINANGPVGSKNLDRIFAHQVGNVFYCLDEFALAPYLCTDRSGYLNVEHANKLRGGEGCKIDVPCVMRAAAAGSVFDDLTPCLYTKGQAGWWDEDEDGIPDILDTDPIVESVSVGTAGWAGIVRGDTLYSTELPLRGTAEAVPTPNMNPQSLNSHLDFTVERVRAECRVNGGEWLPCDPADGRFDESSEEFGVTVTDLDPWFVNKVEVRAVTAGGNVTPDSLMGVFELFVVEPDVDRSFLMVGPSSPARLPASVRFVPFAPSEPRGSLVQVEIAVYDVMGRKIKTLEDGEFASGRLHSTQWDGEDLNGETVSAGVYFVGMSCRGGNRARKMIVIP